MGTTKKPKPKRRPNQRPMTIDPQSLGSAHTTSEPDHDSNPHVLYTVATTGSMPTTIQNLLGLANEPGPVADFSSSSTLSSVQKPGNPLSNRSHLPSTTYASPPPASRMETEVTYNMSMTTISDINMRSILRGCVKSNIFRKCKFYNRDVHGVFSDHPDTMCGQVMRACNITADAAWWHAKRPLIVTTHTNHRNNCIKAMQTRFTGK
jgi:hypothetical protein